jgi:hypothetical protein
MWDRSAANHPGVSHENRTSQLKRGTKNVSRLIQTEGLQFNVVHMSNVFSIIVLQSFHLHFVLAVELNDQVAYEE